MCLMSTFCGHYDHAHYTADLPYDKTASISLTRGTKQGDKLSPLLFGLVFNCLLLALRATGISSRLMTGLRSPARGFAGDLVLCTESAADMNCLMTVASNFCRWSGTAATYQQHTTRGAMHPAVAAWL